MSENVAEGGKKTIREGIKMMAMMMRREGMEGLGGNFKISRKVCCWVGEGAEGWARD